MLEVYDFVPIITSGDVCLNTEECKLSCSGQEISLSSMETDILAVLLINENQYVKREVITSIVFGDALSKGNKRTSKKSFGPTMFFLKEKLRKVRKRDSIENKFGHGYRWVSN